MPITPPSPPYNGGRFTGNLVWAEYLSDKLGVKHDSSDFKNWSIGGAFAQHNGFGAEDSIMGVPLRLKNSVTAQIAGNVFDFNKSKNLYIIWVGANDYWKNVAKPEVDAGQVKGSVDEIIKQVDRLKWYGAKNFVVMGAPNTGLSPAVRISGVGCVQNISRWNKAHNDMLEKELETLRGKYPDLNLWQKDTWKVMTDMYFSGDFEENSLVKPCVCCTGQAGGTPDCKWEKTYDLTREILVGPQVSKCGDPAPKENIIGQNILAHMRQITVNEDEVSRQTLKPTLLSFMKDNMKQSIPSDGKVPDNCSVCPDSDDFMFYDSAHPGKYVHK